jgi:hypothetical protein
LVQLGALSLRQIETWLILIARFAADRIDAAAHELTPGARP